jgi:hypothetical protein
MSSENTNIIVFEENNIIKYNGYGVGEGNEYIYSGGFDNDFKVIINNNRTTDVTVKFDSTRLPNIKTSSITLQSGASVANPGKITIDGENITLRRTTHSLFYMDANNQDTMVPVDIKNINIEVKDETGNLADLDIYGGGKGGILSVDSNNYNDGVVYDVKGINKNINIESCTIKVKNLNIATNNGIFKIWTRQCFNRRLFIDWLRYNENR